MTLQTFLNDTDAEFEKEFIDGRNIFDPNGLRREAIKSFYHEKIQKAVTEALEEQRKDIRQIIESAKLAALSNTSRDTTTELFIIEILLDMPQLKLINSYLGKE